jgi:hypothetical protein
MAASESSSTAIDDKTRRALNKALAAMEDWRDEIGQTTEENADKVFDKLRDAARLAGWPDTLVETTKTQLLQSAKFQTDMMNHISAAWKDQLRQPGTTAAFLGTLAQPAAEQGATSAPATLSPALAATQFWLQAMEMWRTNWANAMTPSVKRNSTDDETQKG